LESERNEKSSELSLKAKEIGMNTISVLKLTNFTESRYAQKLRAERVSKEKLEQQVQFLVKEFQQQSDKHQKEIADLKSQQVSGDVNIIFDFIAGTRGREARHIN
jgi:hypothetical protein